MAGTEHDLTLSQLKEQEKILRNQIRVTSITVSAKNEHGCFVSMTVTPDTEEHEETWSVQDARRVATLIAKETSILAMADAYILGKMRGENINKEKPLVEERFLTVSKAINKKNGTENG
jgi:hypothetical protein